MATKTSKSPGPYDVCQKTNSGVQRRWEQYNPDLAEESDESKMEQLTENELKEKASNKPSEEPA